MASAQYTGIQSKPEACILDSRFPRYAYYSGAGSVCLGHFRFTSHRIPRQTICVYGKTICTWYVWIWVGSRRQEFVHRARSPRLFSSLLPLPSTHLFIYVVFRCIEWRFMGRTQFVSSNILSVQSIGALSQYE